ncbi:DUF2207 domain-containing protein [Actinomadura barringtoniae]|uniref:DUF2207 domain-containing protein n=1 Tax=Actinomadura barringtoniae TaxID=1427535 RepID=A0A939PL98_9ACTN|nr:DUF2207 domain-containing protein [Actinomadura barringtoniae]MBO2454871.1 DUF2207 domain-containing protein [Actinomadura barringtoniae]
MLGRLRTLTISMAIAALLPLTAATARAEAAAVSEPRAASPGAAAQAAPAAPQAAPAASERVVKDDVLLQVGKGGVTHARETIVYEFAGKNELRRSFVTRIHDSVTKDRVFKVENVKATSPDGGPANVSTSSSGTTTNVKVSGGQGTGRHTIVLEYDVRGAVAQIGGGEELRWTAIGGWKVPVDDAQATVGGGTPIRSINCFSGALDSSLGCSQFYFSDHAHTQALFKQGRLLPDEYMTVIVGYPAGATGGKAIYERRHTAATAFSVNGVTGTALLALLILLLGGVGVLYMLRGRDARVVAQKAAEGDQAPVTGTEFEPPDGVRPGQIGTLIDEQADVIDVTATIVDLAVRGYLLIEEDDREVTGKLDWELQRLQRPVSDLLPYEQLLLDALFTAPDGSPRAAVKLSELGGTFSAQLARVRAAMYADVVQQGWFARRPDTVRSRWTIAGFVLTGIGVAATIALALFTDLALIGLAVIVAGAALAYGGQYMPAKTARGATVLAHTIGFRAFLERGEIPADGQAGPQQRIALFSRFLPYAVVFDLVPMWAKTVEDAGVREKGADNLYWYEGPAEWDLSKFAESMRTFTLATSGSISQSRGL